MCAQRRHSDSAAEPVVVPLPQPAVPTRVVDTVGGVAEFLRERGITKPGPMSLIDATPELLRVRANFAGTPVAGTLTHPPPIIVRVPDATIERFVGKGNEACHIPWTNIILVSDSALASPRRSEILVHEITHYAGFRGHDGSSVYRGPNGQTALMGIPVWMEEGLVNAFSSRSASGVSEISYPYETLAGILLEKLHFDPQVIRLAYITGDFRAFQGVVDSQLGSGTFEGMLRCQSGAEAFSFVYSRVQAQRPAFFDEKGFRADPAVQRALSMVGNNLRL
ncbi:MAG: hypothetical protein U0R44_04415 [Candidatus Micrarchaeia archaeon]